MTKLLSLALALALASSPAAEVRVRGSAGRTGVSVVRRVELDYQFVTARRPLEFEVEGPGWVRVYTRLWWQVDGPERQAYGLSLWQDDVERPLEFETARSASSWGVSRHPVGRWRSFYIQVPAGATTYRLVLNEAPLDTVAVRFTRQAPPAWEPVALDGLERLMLVDGSAEVEYRRLAVGKPHTVDVTGPCRLQVRVRLNFEPGMVGAQNYVLAVTGGGVELAAPNLRVSRTGSANWANAAGELPATERSVRFRVGEGTHRLRLELRGTLARSAGVRLERIADEKYE
ncbi:MAG: hypothetical protein R6X12_07175 [bacterium]